MEDRGYNPELSPIPEKPVNEEVVTDFISLFNGLDAMESLREIFGSLPYAAAVLDKNRNVVLTNNSLLEQFGIDSIEGLLGRRPGEVLHCIHATEKEHRCGETESCKYCGALAAMRTTLHSRKQTISEMRLTSQQNGMLVAYDLKITVAPIFLGETIYMIMYLHDISHEKRRKALERIFFHDVLNKISSLRGFHELWQKETNPDAAKNYVEIMGLVLSDLTDEIIAQRQLVAAENGELTVKKEIISIPKMVIRVIEQVKLLSNPKDVSIKSDTLNANVSMISDPILLNRVLTNMIKNAIEASETHETVSITAKVENKKLKIGVHNTSSIPEEIQLQIFHRSFSTKGENRGLGTYSIKLLVERYLGGMVYFKSDVLSGTEFCIEFPYNFSQ